MYVERHAAKVRQPEVRVRTQRNAEERYHLDGARGQGHLGLPLPKCRRPMQPNRDGQFPRLLHVRTRVMDVRMLV